MPEAAIADPAKLFLEKLVSEKFPQNVPSDMKETMVAGLYPRLEAFVLADIAKNLEAKDVADFDKLTAVSKNVNEQKIREFLLSRVPGLDEITAQAMLEFRAVYLNA